MCDTRLVELMKKRIIRISILLSIVFGITVYSHELFYKGMVVTTDNPYYRDLSEWQVPYNDWSNLSTEEKQSYILTFAHVVADILEIKPPKIEFVRLAEEVNGQTYLDGSKIQIDEVALTNKYRAFTTIAHEMRHIWQLEYANYVFDSYTQYNIDREKYVRQTAEMDANIFSAMVFEMIFPDVVIEVNEQGYMRRIDTEIPYYLN